MMTPGRGPFIVADDYGLGAGHNRVIRELLLRRCIDAASVLVDALSDEQALALLDASSDGQQIGLHVNLSEPLASNLFVRPIGRLLADALWGRIDRSTVSARIESQLDRFEAAFGRPPDFVDGHQHCHVFPGVAEPLIAILARRYSDVDFWVRTPCPRTRRGRLRALAAGGPKTAPIMALGGRLRRLLVASGIETNADFSGFLRLNRPDGVAAGFRRALDHSSADTVVMTHPGDPTDSKQTTGHAPAARGIEAEVLRERRHLVA